MKDTAWIPFGDSTAIPGFRGYWVKFAGTSRREVSNELNDITDRHHPGVKVIKVRLVPDTGGERWLRQIQGHQ